MKKTMKTRRAWLALVLVGALLTVGVTGCSSSSDSSAETEETDSAANEESTDADESEESSTDESEDTSDYKVLRIGTGGNGDEKVLELGSLAEANGYFEEELNKIGYTVEWYTFTSAGTEINEALASGDLDAAFYGDFPAFTSKSNGIETTIIATGNQRMQYGILSASEDITSAEDLEGKNVVLLLGSVQQYFWEKYVEETGIDDSGISLINSSDTASLLQTGSADAAAGNIYVEAYQASLGVGSIVAYGSDYDIYTTFVLVLKNNILEEDPEVAVALNKALIRAYEDAIADPEALYAAVETDTMSSEVMKTEYEWDESLWYMSPEIDETTLTYYDELNDWLYENELISEKVDVDSFVDTSYYYQALEELETEE